MDIPKKRKYSYFFPLDIFHANDLKKKKFLFFRDKIILHVPFQIIHHHHAPDYVPIPVKKVQKKPEIVKPEKEKKPEIPKQEKEKFPEIVKEERDSIPVKEEPEPIEHEASIKQEQKERKPRKQHKQKRLKPKRKPNIPIQISSTTPIPLESFLGLDQIFKDTNIPTAFPFSADPIPLLKKNKYNKVTQQLKDYQFSDGTSYYDTKKQPKQQQQQLPVTSYMYTNVDHSQPVHHITGRSEKRFMDESEYEHVGYIVFGDRIHE